MKINPVPTKGEKFFVLFEIGKTPSLGRIRIAKYGREWPFEELEQYFDGFGEMIWEREFPEEAILKKYLDYTKYSKDPIPSMIRVPKTVREILQQERELAQEYRKKSESQRRGRKPRAKAKGEKQ